MRERGRKRERKVKIHCLVLLIELKSEFKLKFDMYFLLMMSKIHKEERVRSQFNF
jgi:hypothetical protein